MLTRILAPLSILLVTLASLPACDPGPDATSPRAVKLTDKWGLHEPVYFPEINSCYDYWNTRCSELTPTQCSYLKARWSCTESRQGGVVIQDGFAVAEQLPPERWVGVGDDGEGEGDSPAAACESLKGDARERCGQLAAIAEALAADLPALYAEAGAGGIAPLVPVEEIKEAPALFEDDAMVQAIDKLEWAVPALPLGARKLAADGIVIEDVIMLMVAPNGTLSLSTRDMTLLGVAPTGK